MSPSGVTSNNAVVITTLGDGQPPDGLVVQSLRYEEALGQPFQLVIEFTRKRTATDLDPAQYYGKQIAVEVSAGIDNKDFKRPFHAIVETFVALGSDSAEGPWRYRVIGVPWIALLKLTKDNRIHGSDGGDTTAWSLLEAIHKEFNFLRINGKLDIKTLAAPAWSRRTQYNESYFDFVHRLLQQIGGFYFWKHTEKDHTLVPDDGEALPAKFDNRVEFADYGISAWHKEATVQPNRVTANDYDYSKSTHWLVVTSVNQIDGIKDKPAAENLPKTRFNVFNFPGGYLEKGDTKVFAGAQHAFRAMQGFECRQIIVSGKAKTCGLSAGFMVKHEGVEYLTTKISLTVQCVKENESQSDTVETLFQAMPLYTNPTKKARIYFRPECDVPVPRIHGVQPANVYKYPYSMKKFEDGKEPDAPAKPQEDVAIHDFKQKPPEKPSKDDPPPPKQTGKYARVKVQFRWSRRESETTDWIRMSHLMAGKGWGEFHLPRQGDEVLVAFEYGDPDRPVIVGSLYNDKSVAPVDLSEEDKEKLAKLFYIRDPGGNLFVMDPGMETQSDHARINKEQTITLLSYAVSARASVQIGHNAEDSPGVPKESH